MNKGVIIAGVIVLLVIGGGFYISNQKSQKADQEKMMQKKATEAGENPEKEAMEKKAAMEKGDTTKDDAMMKKDDSRYVEYSKGALDQAATNRRVLYFYANWCPICKPADADFKANSSKIPSDVTVIRVNYNDSDTDSQEKDLAKKYGIIYQHTFVQIDSQGKEVFSWNGGKTDELLANVK